MKVSRLLIVGMTIVGIILLLYLRKMDNRLWEHVENLTHICYEDGLSVGVRNFKIYNGITEVNSKYLLATPFLEINGKSYIFSETNNIDSIYKRPNSDSLSLWLNSGKLLNLKGDFNCIIKEGKSDF